MLAKGQQYESGDGVGQDYTKAMDYFLSAAETGDAEAMYCYAQMLEDSGGMEAYAAAAAAERYLKCAEACIPEAMYRYAQKLEKGEGVEKNKELAQEWYGKAKEAGYEP